MKVDMPNEREIKAEIDSIIAKGLENRESFHSLLTNMYRQIGIRNLFHDKLEIIFITLLMSSVLLWTIVNGNMKNVEEIYAYLFTISPLLYLTMSIFNFINSKQNNTYEIEMTCKYNIYQISAFRMLVFSIICILFNSLFVYITVYIYEEISYLKAFIISIASLFLFSTVFLLAMTNIRNMFTKYFVFLGWIVFNFALVIFKVNFYIKLIDSISIYTWFAVTIISIVIYMRNLKKLILFRKRKGMIRC